jgi:type IV pilus assembly protein PilX
MATAGSRIHKPDAYKPSVPAQRGAVLIVGLVILLVITMLGITGQQHTVLQERMAGNMRQNDMALQAAEAALQVGLAYVEEQNPIDATGTNFVSTSCTVADTETASADSDDPCTRMGSVLADWEDKVPGEVSRGSSYADVAAKTEAGFGGAIPGVIAQPRVYIEIRSIRSEDAEAAAKGVGTHFYTVSAVGFGANDNARVILQSTIAKEVLP